MILSSDELEILNYLKSWNGKYISMLEICRCAGGRQKYRDDPNWAKGLMGRLVEAKLVLVNERGHYRIPTEEHARSKSKHNKVVIERQTIGEDYFPANTESKVSEPKVIGEDYFPAESDSSSAMPKWLLSPQVEEMVKQSLKKHGHLPPE